VKKAGRREEKRIKKWSKKALFVKKRVEK